MALVDRVKNMIVAPASEWPVIAGETPSVGSLYTGYIMILSAIGPIAIAIMFGLMGAGIATAIVSYVMGLAAVYVLALIVDFLAPHFGGEKNFIRALQLVAYSSTAAWLGGIFHLIPLLGSLLALVAALYSLYLFFLGAPVMRKCTSDKAIVFTIVYVVCAIVVMVVVGTLLGIAGVGLSPMGMR